MLDCIWNLTPIGRAPSSAISGALALVTCSAISLSVARQKLVFEFIELTILLVYLIKSSFIELLLTFGIDLLRDLSDLCRNKSIQGFDQRSRLWPASSMFYVRWLKCGQFDCTIDILRAWRKSREKIWIGDRLSTNHLVLSSVRNLPPRLQVLVGGWHVFRGGMKNKTAALACAALGRRYHLPVFKRQLIWDLEHKRAVKSRPRRNRSSSSLLPAFITRPL